MLTASGDDEEHQAEAISASMPVFCSEPYCSAMSRRTFPAGIEDVHEIS